MATRPLSACPNVGCRGLWDGDKCTVCDRKPYKSGWSNPRRGSRHDRGYDSKWERLQSWKIKTTPWCEQCAQRDDRFVRAMQVHHIKPFRRRDGTIDHALRLDKHNLMSLCKQCHDAMTREHSKAPELWMFR